MSQALDVLAALRLEDGSRWIERAEPWQLAGAEQVIGGERPFTFDTRPRGASKTSDAAGCALAWVLTAPAGARGYWAAADREQAALGLDTIRGYLERTPALRGSVELHAHRVVARESGASFEALPADAASSWGLRPAFLVCDEFAWWADTPAPRQFWESLSSAVAKSRTARLLVITSPSDPSHFAYRVLEHARSDPLWEVRERRGLVPWLDPERVEEQARRLPEAMYRRLFLGEWAEAEDRLTSAEALADCVTHDGPLDHDRQHDYVVALDLGLKRDRTAAVVCHRDGERVTLDRIAVWQGSRLRPVRLADVEEWVEQAARSFGRARIVLDPWQTVGLAQRLRDRGLKVEEFAFTAQSTGRLAATLFNLLRDRALALPDDAELLEELANVRLVERSPGVFRIDHDPGRHDDRAIALALAATHLLREPDHGVPELGPNIWDSAMSDAEAERLNRRARGEPDSFDAPPRRPALPPTPPPTREGRFLIHNQRRSP